MSICYERVVLVVIGRGLCLSYHSRSSSLVMIMHFEQKHSEVFPFLPKVYSDDADRIQSDMNATVHEHGEV